MRNIKRVWRMIVRCAKTAKVLMTSKRLPMWLRAMFIFLVIICQFLIGPLDEIFLLIPFGLTWLLYRDVLSDAWNSTVQAATPAAA